VAAQPPDHEQSGGAPLADAGTLSMIVEGESSGEAVEHGGGSGNDIEGTGAVDAMESTASGPDAVGLGNIGAGRGNLWRGVVLPPDITWAAGADTEAGVPSACTLATGAHREPDDVDGTLQDADRQGPGSKQAG